MRQRSQPLSGHSYPGNGRGVSRPRAQRLAACVRPRRSSARAALAPVVRAARSCTRSGDPVHITARIVPEAGIVTAVVHDDEPAEACLQQALDGRFAPFELGSDCIDCGPKRLGSPRPPHAVAHHVSVHARPPMTRRRECRPIDDVGAHLSRRHAGGVGERTSMYTVQCRADEPRPTKRLSAVPICSLMPPPEG